MIPFLIEAGTQNLLVTIVLVLAVIALLLWILGRR